MNTKAKRGCRCKSKRCARLLPRNDPVLAIARRARLDPAAETRGVAPPRDRNRRGPAHALSTALRRQDAFRAISARGKRYAAARLRRSRQDATGSLWRPEKNL